jgi:hypothetical protein
MADETRYGLWHVRDAMIDYFELMESRIKQGVA